MAAKTELDVIDRRILRLLSQDGRSSYQAIADEVGLSRPAVMGRGEGLEENGHILRYRVQPDRVKAGLPPTAVVALRDGRPPHRRGEARQRGKGKKHPRVEGH